MRLDDLDYGYKDSSADRYSNVNINDTRKKRFTLRHLNKLRKMREVKKMELQKDRDFLEIIYGKSNQNQEKGDLF